MSEEKTIRIGAAAKEFNVGWQHIIEFLVSKGYKVDNKPNTQLTQEMYSLLLKEYNKDKGLKEKADQVNIGIARKIEKPEDLKETKEAEKKEEIAITELQEKISDKKSIEEKQEETVIPETKQEILTPETKTTETEVTKRKKPEVEQPKVVGKIDLDSGKKTKKAKTKKAETIEDKTEEHQTIETAETIQQNAVIEEKPVLAETKNETTEQELIERKKITLEGPKVLGKIELKEEKKPEKKKEQGPSEDDEIRKKRKRIKKPERINVEKVKEEQKREDNQPVVRRVIEIKKHNKDADTQEKIIQEQVRNTLAKLSGSRGKQNKGKFK